MPSQERYRAKTQRRQVGSETADRGDFDLRVSAFWRENDLLVRVRTTPIVRLRAVTKVYDVGLAFFVLVAVGVAAGIVPARRAARLDAAVCLRDE